MILIGLTGGIASGKSLVSKKFAKLGAHIIDADLIARQVVEPQKPAWKEIIDYFGQDILGENKYINRPKLGRLIFNNPAKREKLNEITHPKILEEIKKQKDELLDKNLPKLIIIDAALLIETNLHTDMDKIIVVYVDEKTQIQRLMERDNISPPEALKKIKSQTPLTEKIKYADFVIDNNSSIEDTYLKVENIFQVLISLQSSPQP